MKGAITIGHMEGDKSYVRCLTQQSEPVAFMHSFLEMLRRANEFATTRFSLVIPATADHADKNLPVSFVRW